MRFICLGERGVLNLAFDKRAVLLFIDDRKTRNGKVWVIF
jgi:predicted nucleic acid-binding protein